jgi:hypothetical protein
MFACCVLFDTFFTALLAEVGGAGDDDDGVVDVGELGFGFKGGSGDSGGVVDVGELGFGFKGGFKVGLKGEFKVELGGFDCAKAMLT